jgi:hypothetical protein
VTNSLRILRWIAQAAFWVSFVWIVGEAYQVLWMQGW